MNIAVMAEIVRNAGILLALALLYDVISGRTRALSGLGARLGTGLAIGLLGIGIMATPYLWHPGVIFDARSVLLGISGLFFGAAPTAVAMVVMGAYRAHMGGAGALMGVLVIMASGGIGIAWRYGRRDQWSRIGLAELYLLGLILHGVMLALTVALPQDLRLPVLTGMAVPVLVVLPTATAALGGFMASRLRRERMAVALEASEARYRSLFDDNPAVTLVVDPLKGQIVDANPAAIRFYGWPRDELIGRSISRVNAMTESGAQAELDRAVASERTSFQVRHRLASGDVRDVDVNSGAVTVEGRTLMYSIVRDVTREQQVRKALELQGAALDAAANAIVITDKDGTIEWVNSAFCRLYGYAPEEVIGQNPRTVVGSGIQDEAFYADIWDTILAGGTWTGHLTNRRKDGTLVEEEMAITPLLDSAGRIGHFIAVKQDLTERRALERRLALAEKLEALGQLAGGIAHDFNNILTVINGTVDLILTDMPDDHPLRRDLEEVRTAGDRAGALTSQLLAFGHGQVQRKEVLDLNDLIRDVDSLLRRVLGEHIAIVTDLADETLLVFADRGQLEQVLVNLAVNGRDAMPTGGTLRIATQQQRFQALESRPASEVPAGAYIRLTVSDTGSGIDPSIQAQVFDPFFTTKEVGRGTGLGLATVYGIVSQNGGHVRLESEPGEGTTFEVLLPVTDQGPPSPARKPRSQAQTVPGTGAILVVEDEAPIRDLAARTLERAGYTVLVAASGAEALELLRARAADVSLLFSDIIMPGLSGPALLQRARALQPGLKVLFTSGYAGPSRDRHGISSTGAPLLEKPYTVETLTRMVRLALEGDKGTRASA
jgi:two-component system, cell cycle sensor histidine kinase and response regulator CckA